VESYNEILNGDDLILLLLNGKTGSSRSYSNQLLDFIWDGYPVENILPLFKSKNNQTLRAAVWISSELGSVGRILISDILVLLKNSDPYIRFWAIDALIAKINEQDGKAMCAVLSMIKDKDVGVRWKVLDFLARIPIQCITVAINQQYQEHHNEYVFALKVIKSAMQAKTFSDSQQEQIIGLVNNKDKILKALGAIAAYHYSSLSNKSCMLLSNSPIEEIRNFFADMYQEFNEH